MILEVLLLEACLEFGCSGMKVRDYGGPGELCNGIGAEDCRVQVDLI